MANKKINELLSRTPSLSDLMLVGDPSSGYSYKCTVTALATIIETDIADGYVTLATAQTISGAKTFSNVLTLTSVPNSAVDTDKFLVLTGTNTVNYRTGSEVLSDIGGQGALTLTTTGTSGAATLVGNTLNIPNYAPDLSGYVPTSRTLTINGTAYDLTANRSWSVGTVTSVGLSSATSGVTIGSTPITTSGTITLAIATASGTQQGLLSSTDWTTFNNKQNALTNPVTGTGNTNYIPKFTGTSSIGNSQVFDNGTNVLIGTNSTGTYIPTTRLGVLASSAAAAIGIYGRALDNEQRIDFQNNDGSARIMGITAGNTQANIFVDSNIPLIFSTNASERMRLDASGNLGLGTSSPSGQFHTYTSGDKQLLVTYPSTFATRLTIGNAAFYIQNDASPETFTFVNATGSGIFDWKSGASATQRMRLDGSGNLGLGVTPSAWSSGGRIEIGNDKTIVAQGPSILLGANLYFNSGFKYVTTGASTFYYQTDGQHQWYTAPSGTAGNTISFTQAMTLDASGRLAVGTSTFPTQNSGSLAGTAIFNGIVRISGSSTRYFTTGNGLELAVGSIYSYNRDLGAYNDLGINDAMTVKGAGNVGIGTTSPASKLHISAGYGLVNNAYSWAVYNQASNAFAAQFGAAADIGFVGAGDNAIITASGSNAILFGTNSSERMRITSGGELLINTTSDAGDYKLQVNGSVYIATGYNLDFGTTASLFASPSTGHMYFEYAASNSLIFRDKTSGAMALTLTSSENAEFGGSIKTGGSLTVPYVTKTATYTLNGSDYTVYFDAIGASANLTANLPDATTCKGRIYTIMANVNATYNVTIDGNGSQTIGGSTTLGMWDGCNQKATIVIQSDGANWQIISFYAYDNVC